jgi:hypothetical protein
MSLTIDTLTVENTLSGTAVVTAIQSELTTQKGSANGIATLNGSGQIPTSQLPSFVDDVLEFANLASFPVTGETGKIYTALDTNKTYRWSGSVYVQTNSGDVNSVFGRQGNVVALAGDYTAAQVGADTVGSAASAQAFSIQRTNHTGSQLASTISDFFSQVLATILTGISFTTSTAVLATDTILQAIGKLQAQLNLTKSFKTTSNLVNNSQTTLTTISELAVSVVAGKTYQIDCYLMFQSVATTTGAAFSALLSGGAAGNLSLLALIPNAADGTASIFSGTINASGDVVVSTATPVINVNYTATITGVFVCTTSGTFTPQFRSENNGSNVTLIAGSCIKAREI